MRGLQTFSYDSENRLRSAAIGEYDGSGTLLRRYIIDPASMTALRKLN